MWLLLDIMSVYMAASVEGNSGSFYRALTV